MPVSARRSVALQAQVIGGMRGRPSVIGHARPQVGHKLTLHESHALPALAVPRSPVLHAQLPDNRQSLARWTSDRWPGFLLMWRSIVSLTRSARLAFLTRTPPGLPLVRRWLQR
jgi:hypothetical protein